MKPGKLDLPTIWRGCDWGPVLLKWKDQNGEPMNLSGWAPSANSINVNLRPSIIDVAQGHTIMQLTKADTSVIGLGVEQWDWIWERPAQPYRYPPFLSGKIAIKDPVTLTNGQVGPPGDGDGDGNGDGNGGPPDVVPDAPIAVSATNVSFDSFDANWLAAVRATSYRVDVASDEEFTKFIFQDVNVGNVLTWTFSGLASHVRYYYRVRARNSGGTSSNSNVIFLTTTAEEIPPEGIPINDSFADQIELFDESGHVGGTTVNATTETGEPSGENSVWYRWTPPGPNATVFLTSGENRISIYVGTEVGALFHVATSAGGPLPTANWTADPGTPYRIRVYKDTVTAGFALAWTINA